MNINDQAEYDTNLPAGFTSVNADLAFTNRISTKPYDHAMFRPAFTGGEIDTAFGFRVVNLGRGDAGRLDRRPE